MYVCSRHPRGLTAGEYAALLNSNPNAKELGLDSNAARCDGLCSRSHLASRSQDGGAGWLASRVDEHREPGARRKSSCFSRLTLNFKSGDSHLASLLPHSRS